MTINEYEQRLDALAREIADLKLEVFAVGSDKPPHQRWKPKSGKLYYTINIGNACAGSNTWDSDNVDGDIYSLGFVFKTEAETEFAIERLKVLAEMREWAGNWNDPYELVYDGCEVEVGRDYIKSVTYGELRFACNDDAENCIKAVGKDRLIKYYFGVRDHEIPNETE